MTSRNAYMTSRFSVPASASPLLPLIILYNNVGLTSKASEEIASESIENCRFRQPRCGFTPLSREPLRISA